MRDTAGPPRDRVVPPASRSTTGAEPARRRPTARRPRRRGRAGRSAPRHVVPALAGLVGAAALLLGLGTAGPRAASVGASLIDEVPLAGAITDDDWSPDAPSVAARSEIPPAYLDHYLQFGAQMGVDWRFLASIGAQESDHGRHPATGRVNRSGCVGPMQLGIGGECGDFVGEFGRLRAGQRAPPPGGSFEEHRRAACRYYGACASPGVDYADEVMERAVRYGFPDDA
jgi:hypothetical protein